MGRLKILSVTETLQVGGDETRLLNLTRALDRARYAHTIVVTTRTDAEGDAIYGPMASRLEAAGAELVQLGLPRRGFGPEGERSDLSTLAGGLRRAPALLGQLADVIRGIRPDVLDLHKHYAIAWGALAGRFCRVPAIVGTEYFSELLDPPLRRAAAGVAFRLLDAFVSDAAYSAEGYERRLPFLKGRTHVIPNGVAIPRPRLPRSKVRRLLGMKRRTGRVVFGQVARFAPFKGQLILLEAARKVLAARPGRASFLLCGYDRNSEYRAAVTRKVSTLGLDDEVTLASYPGPSDDIWPAIDVHVHPSLRDSSPIAIHESMALGLPAIVSRVGGAEELVEPCRTGLIVEPGDPHALADAMIRLLDEPGLARRLGAGARARYARHYTPEAMARRTTDLFSSLAAAAGRPALAAG